MTSPPDVADTYGLHVAGERRQAAEGERFVTENPATAEPSAEVAAATPADVDDAVAAAREAFADWRRTGPEERTRTLLAVADAIRDRREELARLESLDQGKPLSLARSDFDSAARYFEFYAGCTDKVDGRTVPRSAGTVDYTVREPYGVSAQVTPWNFPGNLFARGVAPALAAANATVVKPAPQTPLTTLRLAAICEEAGLPTGLVNVVPGGAAPGEALTGHAGVDTITFTGSVPTGQAIMEAAAEHVTPVTLELGGKNPAVVFPDADLEDAAEHVARGIFTNAGQVCSAADRLVVHEDVHDEVLERVVDIAEATTLGPGLEDPDMGPLASAAQLEKVERYVDIGLTDGATLATGGDVPDRPGYFVEPTVFTDVDPDARLAQEEVFGPVLAVSTFADDAEALDIANGVDYGLVAGVFTGDVSRAHRFTRRLQAGNVWVNTWFGGTNHAPFGGYKQSGFGREKGLEALDSYLQTKNVAVDLGGEDGLPGA